MKSLLILLCLVIAACASAQDQTEKKMMAHLKVVQESREKQSIIWDMDTVYVSGIPYCIVVEKKTGFMSPHDYSVRSLKGKELIYLNHYVATANGVPECAQVARGVDVITFDVTNVEYYVWHFNDTQQEAQTSTDYKVYKMVVENNLVLGDSINKEGEANFLTKYVAKYSGDTSVQAAELLKKNAKAYGADNMVKRNRSAIINIFGDTIKQGGFFIGTVKIKQDNENKIPVKIVSFYFPNGTLMAEGKAYGHNTDPWIVATLKDNRIGRLKCAPEKEVLDLVKYLVEGLYL